MGDENPWLVNHWTDWEPTDLIPTVCTCGTHATMGTDWPDDKHSPYCDIRKKYERDQSKKDKKLPGG